MTGTAGFDAFYAATSRRTLRQLAALCGDAAEAQDLVQEAYARAWQHWTRVARYDDPEAWVRKVAFRLAANRWRSTRRWLTARTRHGAPPDASPPSLDHVAIVAALRSLSPDQRRVVVLYYLCGLSVAEIAADTGTQEGTPAPGGRSRAGGGARRRRPIGWLVRGGPSRRTRGSTIGRAADHAVAPTVRDPHERVRILADCSRDARA